MSSNASDDGPQHHADSPNVLDVGFSSIANGRNAESSSMAESRSSGKRSTGSWRRSRQQEATEDPVTPDDKSKRHEEDGNSPSHLGTRSRRSGGFLLDSAFANVSPKASQDTRGSGKRKAQNGQLQVDKRRQGPSRVSGESSRRGSPLAREVAWVDGGSELRETPRATSMEPAQLVQMALNLSESRKRNISNTLQVPLSSSKRVISMPISTYGTIRTSSATRKRPSQVGDAVARDSSRSNTSQEIEVVSHVEPDNVMYTFSPATLARAEKARKYFELANEHRRLLEHLPPLVPDANAPGNFTYESRNLPGSPFPEIRRVTSGADERHALGRQYNPIQALRNRRVRLREKRPFPASLESWANPDDVAKWVDDVEKATQVPYYRATADEAQVPRYIGDDGEESIRLQHQSSSHRRTDTVGTVITRPENSWTIEPTELLADTYWTEKVDNKAYIENRHGYPIFGQPEPKKLSTPKISVEMHRGREEQSALGISEQDFEEPARPARRKRLLLPLTTRPDDHRKRHRRLISRSSSTSSESGTDDGRRSQDGDENIGPLEKHMQELIAKDEKGELSSPDVTSPTEHWDLKARPRPSIDQVRKEAFGREGRGSLEVPRDLHKRSRSADGRVNSVDGKTPSTEQEVEPTSTKSHRATSSIDLARTLTMESRRSLETERSQTFKFPSFSRNTERSNTDEVDFAAATASTLSPIMSGDQWRPRTSLEAQRPRDARRHKTNESINGSLHRLDTSSSTTGTFTSIREPGSTVGRLFKGGRDRIGTLVRGERFRNKDRLDTGTPLDQYRAASDVSDLEDAEGPNGYLVRRGTDSPANDSDVSPRGSLEKARSKQKYQLPAFTSSSRARRMVPGTPISADTNPFDTRKTTPNDTTKNSRLIPPRINIPTDNTPNDAPMATTIRFDTGRKSYGQLGIDTPTPNSISTSRSPGRRHWSIYDQVQPLPLSNKVTARDVARVRALLLCSGIKARELYRRGNLPISPPSPALLLAASTTSRSPPTPLLKDEALTIASMLSNHLSEALTNHESLLANFQTQTTRNLASTLDELRQTVSDRLAPAVHEAADAADAFTVELTTQQPQQTKRVDEAVDTLVRRRRRHFRLARQAGFKLLEWVVLSIMWGIWFTVVIINIIRKTFVGVGKGIRWLVVF